MASPNTLVTAPQWLINLLLACLTGGVGIYVQYINAAIKDEGKARQRIELNQVYFDSGLEVIDGKLELLLEERGLTYTGPTYHRRMGQDAQGH